MSTPKNFLVPLDFSEFSEHVLDYAVELAGKLGGKVHLLNVAQIPSGSVGEMGFVMTTSVIDELLVASRATLDQLAAARRATGVIGDVLVRTGDPRDVILDCSESLRIDLIVMGTHGRRGISRALLGSVAESVVRTARCPVLTIRAPKGGSK